MLSIISRGMLIGRHGSNWCLTLVSSPPLSSPSCAPAIQRLEIFLFWFVVVYELQPQNCLQVHKTFSFTHFLTSFCVIHSRLIQGSFLYICCVHSRLIQDSFPYICCVHNKLIQGCLLHICCVYCRYREEYPTSAVYRADAENTIQMLLYIQQIQGGLVGIGCINSRCVEDHPTSAVYLADIEKTIYSTSAAYMYIYCRFIQGSLVAFLFIHRFVVGQSSCLFTSLFLTFYRFVPT